MAATSPEQKTESEMPFLTHLVELRDRLMRSLVAVGLIFLALFSFANQIYHLLATPLLKHMPAGGTMIATEVGSPFFTPFKLVMVVSVILAVPYLLYQLWSFIAPGLYKHEKRLAFPLLFSSVILFYAGMAFAYFVVFPLAFTFLTANAPEGVTVMTDISKYLDFVLTVFFAFGVAFEVPIATILLVLTGMATPESLVSKRPYIIVGCFTVGMFLTPPDVISQTLLAVPMWMLFEIGVFASRFMLRRKEKDTAERETEAKREMTDDEMNAEFEKAIADEHALLNHTDAGKDDA